MPVNAGSNKQYPHALDQKQALHGQPYQSVSSILGPLEASQHVPGGFQQPHWYPGHLHRPKQNLTWSALPACTTLHWQIGIGRAAQELEACHSLASMHASWHSFHPSTDTGWHHMMQ